MIFTEEEAESLTPGTQVMLGCGEVGTIDGN